MGDYFENKEWYDQDSSLIYDHDPLTSKDSLRFYPNSSPNSQFSKIKIRIGPEYSSKKASLLHKYNKKYFLIHGTGDDNVHFRHSALWEQRLIEAGIWWLK